MAEDAAYRESPLPSEQPLGGEKDDYNDSTSSMDEFLPAAADAEEYTESPDYYTLLNLPREPAPTDAQIRAAFRTLTLSFHPDKQPLELREAAAHQYDRIRIAYETLSDPHRRVVYDMLGEEGVRAEWGVGGSMGRSGEAERSGMALGVRAMDERQFRKWFLETMRKRERKALNELVQARGSIKVNFDARSMITTDAEGTPTLQVPNLNLTSYSLGYSFRTPFSPLRWLSGLSSNGEEEPARKSVAPNNFDTEEEEPDDMLEIKAGINGKLHELKKKIRLVDQKTDREFDKEIKMGNVLIAEGFTLGATWRHAIGDLPKKTGPVISRLGLSLFENSVLETTTNIFPFPSVQTAISKAVTPIAGTQPFLVNLKTIYNRSLWECPPVVNLSIQRQVGLRNIAHLNWSSGVIFWPQFIIDLITTPSEDSPIIVSHDSSHIELGYTVVPLNKEILVERHTAKHVKADVEDYEARELAWEKARCDPQETWGVMVHSSPNTPLALSCNYARTLFAQRFEPGGDRVLSEWTGEGYKPNRPVGMNDVVEGSGIRLEISSMLRAEDLSIGWWIDGTRRITEFTKLGLGVGLQGGNGLMMHIVWKRLSQRVRVPIILVPVQNVTFNLCMLAAALPWTVYTLYEYGVRRPRQRKRWLKHARNERRRLERLVAGKKEEALRAIQLMKDQVLRRQEKEQSRDGLVILSAEYGYIPLARSPKSGRTASAVAHDSRDPMTIDVTIPVAALVDQGQLNISDKVVKWQLIGFWDPAPLRPKTLCVRYLFQGQEHVVQVGDNEPLSCPMRTHLVD